MKKESEVNLSPLSREERVTVPVEAKDIPKIIGSIQHTLTELSRSGKFVGLIESTNLSFKSGTYRIYVSISDGY